MKIMYCITSASWGGAQLHVLEMCEHEVSIGNDVVFVVGNHGPLLDKVKRIKNIKVIVVPELCRELNLISDFQVIFKLRKLLKQEKPELFHLHSSKAGTVGRIAAIGLPVKTIFTVHGWAFTEGAGSELKRNAYTFVEWIVSPLTDLYICVSKFDYDIGVKRHVLKLRKKNAVVIKNGVSRSIDEFKRKKVHKPIRLVMTARFSTQKDQESLIRALYRLNEYNYIMTFVGDGETLDENRALVKKLKIDSKIKFVGFKNDVSPYLLDSDIYILSTHYEGLPISIIEAMSYGLPIIATDVGGNSEIVKNGVNGYLVSSESIYGSLKDLLTNKNKISSFGYSSFQIWKNDLQLSKQFQLIDSEYRKLIK